MVGANATIVFENENPMLNIKSLIAATVLTGFAALSFAAAPEAPKAAEPVAVAAAPAAAMAKPAAKKAKHAKKVKKSTKAAASPEAAK